MEENQETQETLIPGALRSLWAKRVGTVLFALAGIAAAVFLYNRVYDLTSTWEITSLMRFGLAQRDTEASAISYNLTV